MCVGCRRTTRMISDQREALDGITAPICATVPLPHDIRAEEFGVFPGALPEDKYALVQGRSWCAYAAIASLIISHTS